MLARLHVFSALGVVGHAPAVTSGSLARLDDDGDTMLEGAVQLDDAPEAEGEEQLPRIAPRVARGERGTDRFVRHERLCELALDEGRRDEHRRAAGDHATEVEIGGVAWPLPHLGLLA